MFPTRHRYSKQGKIFPTSRDWLHFIKQAKEKLQFVISRSTPPRSNYHVPPLDSWPARLTIWSQPSINVLAIISFQEHRVPRAVNKYWRRSSIKYFTSNQAKVERNIDSSPRVKGRVAWAIGTIIWMFVCPTPDLCVLAFELQWKGQGVWGIDIQARSAAKMQEQQERRRQW